MPRISLKKIQSWSQSAKNTELDDVFLAKKRNSFWIMLRKYSSNIPDIPRWEGYVFSTGIEPKRKIVTSYFPVILHPITDKLRRQTKLSGRSTSSWRFNLGCAWKFIILYEMILSVMISIFFSLEPFIKFVHPCDQEENERLQLFRCSTWGWVSHVWYHVCWHAR